MSPVPQTLTVLICTYNRTSLLARVLESLQAAKRPEDWRVRILVMANACTDGTHALLEAEHQAGLSDAARIPLDWLAEPRPGKSHALNSAIPHVMDSDLVTFVDDDHRVDAHYLMHICAAAKDHPEATLFCGRILPDWDGSEPKWVHDEGPYRIYPLPVPRQDFGADPRLATLEKGPLPGGGNLFLRPSVFSRVGSFSTELGPKGHDLGGGEDSAFILTALEGGERLQYVPGVLQYHYVDHERLRLPYLLRKAYQRSSSASRVHSTGRLVPLYMWRKLAGYALRLPLPLGWSHLRFYLMRVASTLGEIHGLRAGAASRWPKRPRRQLALPAVSMLLYSAGLTSLHATASPEHFWAGIAGCLAVATALTLFISSKSLMDFSRTGPQIRQEILTHYRIYSLYAFARLLAFAFLIILAQGMVGTLVYAALAFLAEWPFNAVLAAGAALAGTVLLTGLQFCRHLLFLPASLVASSHYRMSRLYALWSLLSPARLRLAIGTPMTLVATLALLSILKFADSGSTSGVAAALFFSSASVALYFWLRGNAYPPARKNRRTKGSPNILMIGSDTLRADRIGPKLTPFLDKLSDTSFHFTHCYVPCARTAPSLISLFTGTWPYKHGIRDNFIADNETLLPVATLPSHLGREGYFSASLSDWCGADLGKFSLGFDYVDLPEDQWNLKYLIRQGPKDLRLFLSLFTHNRFGKDFLPELHYLGGVPMTDELGQEACHLLNRLSQAERPFLLNLFFSTTHPPFGSEYPYYTWHSSRDYTGESKFAMARLTDPWEIIRRQAEPREAFDLDQILNLYDGCVRRFDDEVARIVGHLEQCGLAENTLICIYSDHGMEFFEHGNWGQGNSAIGEYSARIPMLIVDPRYSKGRKIDDVVRSIDIPATLLDLAGLPPLPGSDGVSLADYLRDPKASTDLAACYETGIWLTTLPSMPDKHLSYPNIIDLLGVPDQASGTLAIKPEFREIVVMAKDRMLRSGKWKLVYQPLTDGALWKLFDVLTDPECRHDVKEQQPEVLSRMQQAMLDWLRHEGVAIRAQKTPHPDHTVITAKHP